LLNLIDNIEITLRNGVFEISYIFHALTLN
jgi:hypothetical protein